MMSEIDIRSIVRQEIRRQMDVILSGSAGNATNIAEDIQDLYPGMPGIVGRPMMHPYGFCSLAPDGTIQVTAKQGENFNNRLVLGHRAADRPTDLENGETCIYSSSGFRVVWKDGKILIGKGDTLEVAVMGEALLNYLTQMNKQQQVEQHIGNLGFQTSYPTNADQYLELEQENLDNNFILAEDGGRF